MIPTSGHNEALAGDSLYSAFLNYEWRIVVLPFIIRGMEQLAATIEDESDRQDFEVLYGAMIDDFYNEDIVDNTPVGAIVAYPSATVPTKWMLCNQQELLKTDYLELWTAATTLRAIQTGTGLDIVRLPSLNATFIRGTITEAVINTSVGADTHTLTEAELPAHTHTIAHTHNIPTATAVGTTATRVADGSGVAGTTVPTLGSNTPNSGSTGNGAAHNNIPLSTHMAWIIKVLP